jgi:hypothetical protein
LWASGVGITAITFGSEFGRRDEKDKRVVLAFHYAQPFRQLPLSIHSGGE